MRIQCEDVQGFIENLKKYDSSRIFEKTVWVDITKASLSEVVDQVTFQATAIIQTEDGGEFVVKVGIDCGRDYADNSGVGLVGTEIAEKLCGELETFCEEHGLVVLPGIISE